MGSLRQGSRSDHEPVCAGCAEKKRGSLRTASMSEVVICDQARRPCLPFDVRFLPKTTLLRGREMTRRARTGLMQHSKEGLLDHLVGAGEQRGRHREA
jgi:hypothetical protein